MILLFRMTSIDCFYENPGGLKFSLKSGVEISLIVDLVGSYGNISVYLFL